MDIHPPMGHMESLKEYAAHILVVTIGILIALGLEGLRESWHERHMVNEARESFRVELTADRSQLARDQESFASCTQQLNSVLAEMPKLIKTPGELSNRIDGIKPGFYLFSTTSWDSAQAAGTVGLFKLDERNRFLYGFLSIKNYQGFTNNTLPDWISTQTFFESHHSYSTQEAAEGEQKLRTLKRELEIIHHLSEQMDDSIKDAIGPSDTKK